MSNLIDTPAVADLREQARKRAIAGYGSMTEAELRAALDPEAAPVEEEPAPDDAPPADAEPAPAPDDLTAGDIGSRTADIIAEALADDGLGLDEDDLDDEYDRDDGDVGNIDR